jgi:hypothetical protein
MKHVHKCFKISFWAQLQVPTHNSEICSTLVSQKYLNIMGNATTDKHSSLFAMGPVL